MSNEDHETFQRSPHDKENPYVMVNRDLIRDNSITPDCRWLLIFLLSHSNDWIIKVPYIINHLRGHKNCGKNRVYEIVNEAITAGYVKREEYLVNNMTRYRYLVSERPSFSKNSYDIPNAGISGAGMPASGTVKKEHKKESSSSLRFEEEKQKKKCPASPVPTAIATELSTKFFSAIKKTKENFREPNFKKWGIEIDKMIRVDKISPERIHAVIDWLPTDDFWKVNILSAEKLRLQFDKLELARQSSAVAQLIKHNRTYALQKKQEYPDRMRKMKVSGDFITNSDRTDTEVSLKMQPKDFKIQLFKLFGGEYHGN